MIRKREAVVYFSESLNKSFFHLKSAIKAEAKARIAGGYKYINYDGEYSELLRSVIKEVKQECKQNECYAKFDSRMSFRDDKLEIANSLGFNFISEAIERMYYDDEPVKLIAKTFEMDLGNLYKLMKKNGVFMKKRGEGRVGI